MKNSFKGTNFLINIYKPLGMFRLPRQKTKKNYETQQVNRTSKHAYVSHACTNYDVVSIRDGARELRLQGSRRICDERQLSRPHRD